MALSTAILDYLHSSTFDDDNRCPYPRKVHNHPTYHAWQAQVDMLPSEMVAPLLASLKSIIPHPRMRRRVKHMLERRQWFDNKRARRKMAEAGSSFIRDKLRGVSFARRIFPPIITPQWRRP